MARRRRASLPRRDLEKQPLDHIDRLLLQQLAEDEANLVRADEELRTAEGWLFVTQKRREATEAALRHFSVDPDEMRANNYQMVEA